MYPSDLRNARTMSGRFTLSEVRGEFTPEQDTKLKDMVTQHIQMGQLAYFRKRIEASIKKQAAPELAAHEVANQIGAAMRLIKVYEREYFDSLKTTKR